MSDAVAHGVHQIMAYVLPSRCGLPSGTVVDVAGLPVVSMMGVVDDRPAGANRLRQVSFEADGDEDGQSKANVLPASRGHRDTSEAFGEPGKCLGRGSGGRGLAGGSVAARDSTIPSTPPSEPEGASQVLRTKSGEERVLRPGFDVEGCVRQVKFRVRAEVLRLERLRKRAAMPAWFAVIDVELEKRDVAIMEYLELVDVLAQRRRRARAAAAFAERRWCRRGAAVRARHGRRIRWS